MTPKIEKLIVKYITKSASASDLDKLFKWIQTPANKQKFKEYVQAHYVITYSMNEPDTEKVADRLLRTIRKEKTWIYRLKAQPIYKYAAVLIGVLATTYFVKEQWARTTKNDKPVIVNNQIRKGTDKATLTLENGTEVILGKGTQYQTTNISSDGEKLTYKMPEITSSTITYNVLTVPQGGQFFLKLSDDTKVWLNSKSQLRYPVSFEEQKSRSVELIYGEAYFDVSHSTEHGGTDFKVHHGGQEIQVLGTEFNVKAYEDETNVYTTLVEGKVAIAYKEKSESLVPNEQAVLDTNANTLTVRTVQVYREVSWKDGVFSFRDKSLKEIMKTLSRWYDMDIEFDNKKLENITFNGSLLKKQSIVEILDAISSSTPINYEINGKKVTLK